MTAPTSSYPTAVTGPAIPVGLVFPDDGFSFDAGYPLTFPPDPPGDLSALFPTIIPEAEQIIYQRVNDACNTRVMFPADGQGLLLPASFSMPPDVSLFKGLDSTSTVNGMQVQPIPVLRGWPTYTGQVPMIGIAESTSTESPEERATQGGFAGDVYAVDALGNVLATCAYYAEPLHITVVVELIHTNRDERDRLHDQLRRVIFPLRHVLGEMSPQVWDVTTSAEKQDVPVDEQPIVMYVSLYTIEVWGEALIPTEIVTSGVIESLTVTVVPTATSLGADFDAEPDLT